MNENLDLTKAFEYENLYYATCENSRILKLIAQYEIFKKTINVPGVIIECGIFKGSSFLRLAAFRQLFVCDNSKRLIGFDTFGVFPETQYQPDIDRRNAFIKEAGENSIKIEHLTKVLERKEIKNYDLIKGDINQTVPEFVQNYPALNISFLHIDVDIYEPSKTILEYFYPYISKNGIIMLDDYGKFPGETKAVNEFLKNKNLFVETLTFTNTPTYIVNC